MQTLILEYLPLFSRRQSQEDMAKHLFSKFPECSGHSKIETGDFLSTWSTPGPPFLTFQSARGTHFLSYWSIPVTNVPTKQSAPSFPDREWSALVNTWSTQGTHF